MSHVFLIGYNATYSLLSTTFTVLTLRIFKISSFSDELSLCLSHGQLKWIEFDWNYFSIMF